MRHRIRSVTPDIDREGLTLYGGLFLVVLFGYGASVQLIFEGLLGDGLSLDVGFFFVGGMTFGAPVAVAAVVFLKIHRYAYPPDA